MIGVKQYTLATGVPVVLKTQPVDPRSLFSGDYVRLSYTVSTFNSDAYPVVAECRRGDTVFVVLKRTGEFHEAVSLHRERPSSGPGETVIKGRVASLLPVFRPKGEVGGRTVVTVKYGIENYYVPEGEGRKIERPKPGQTVSVRVVVDRFGNAGIRAILVDGLEQYTESLF